jgi:recombinational DNA repair ATPase RecF
MAATQQHNHNFVSIKVPTTMHIKQITISNFRSFRQQGEIHPFSAGTNTVVGRNGSGKSNLFDAVQFCLLAPRFAHLRQVRRAAVQILRRQQDAMRY